MINKKYEEWLNSDYILNEDKNILKNMNEEEIKEAFFEDLAFGTAGIRGIMGLGTNRINKYTIGKVTCGLANYINKNHENGSVVVAYDTRNNSKEFAKNVCLILNYYNIKTYLFDFYTSTPELAFAVKYLNCTNGIVITSSHNAKIYNGYKVYNSLGGQIVPPEDKFIIDSINDIKSLEVIKMAPENNELFNIVDDIVHQEFLKENITAISNIKLLEEYGSKVKITYSSLHGVGIKTAQELFEKFNINYNIVKEQCTYDGNFTTAPEPNPEYLFNYDLAKTYANENTSDLIILTDPDSDRLGAMYKDNNEYKFINGNLLGILFANYIIENNDLSNSYMVKSIVTTPMLDKICKENNIECYDVLTGCKNIANKKEQIKDKKYLFGYEESLGYMFNIDINDKNGFSSMLVLIEIMCSCIKNNITFKEYIEKIYKKYGYYLEETLNFTYKGIESKNIIENFMNDFRNDKIKLKNTNYTKKDYLNEVGELKTNALKYIFDDNSWLILRPSGTEPKIKIYLGATQNSMDEAQNKINLMKDEINNIFSS